MINSDTWSLVRREISWVEAKLIQNIDFNGQTLWVKVTILISVILSWRVPRINCDLRPQIHLRLTQRNFQRRPTVEWSRQVCIGERNHFLGDKIAVGRSKKWKLLNRNLRKTSKNRDSKWCSRLGQEESSSNEQQTNRQTNWPKSLPGFSKVSLSILTNQTSSIKALLHRKVCYHPWSELTDVARVLWRNSYARVWAQGVVSSPEFHIRQQCSPRLTSQKDSWALSKSDHPSARGRIPGERELWRRRKMWEKKAVKNIQRSIMLRKWRIREEGKQSCEKKELWEKELDS